jgi:hypothetical protein
MGVSVAVEWPGSTEEQRGGHPGFWNDDHLWANWMLNVLDRPAAAQCLQDLGCGVLLLHTTTGMAAADIGWARPEAFEKAATRLANLVSSKDGRVKTLMDVYRIEWDQAFGEEGGQTPEVAFSRDLDDVAAIARYARSHGAGKMTLGYYW